MKRSRYSEEQIIGILKEHQAGMSAGLTTFGAPRAGGAALAKITSQIPGKRYIFGDDIVPELPHRWPLRYRHDRLPDRKYIPGDRDQIKDHRMENYLSWARTTPHD